MLVEAPTGRSLDCGGRSLTSLFASMDNPVRDAFRQADIGIRRGLRQQIDDIPATSVHDGCMKALVLKLSFGIEMTPHQGLSNVGTLTVPSPSSRPGPSGSHEEPGKE